MTSRAEKTGFMGVIGKPGSLLAALAIGVVLVSLGFYVSGLRVGGINGTVGIVENVEAPPEAWRVVPAADVEVLILWMADVVNATPASSRCARAVLMRTNSRGEYSIGRWWLTPSWPLLVKGYGDVYVSKASYAPITDRGRLPPDLPYSQVLGPSPMNPWTGLPLPDENLLGPADGLLCPPVERL